MVSVFIWDSANQESIHTIIDHRGNDVCKLLLVGHGFRFSGCVPDAGSVTGRSDSDANAIPQHGPAAHGLAANLLAETVSDHDARP